ncbi:MAG TPA: phosphoribosylformylglycinamidine cyclo-ligase [Candidatus Dormibacteraeota bacterium]|nr:phosphoribosylformylglycinamidine cyclo-ligase [Candidatus Dormibacteraeota bacterium]
MSRYTDAGVDRGRAQAAVARVAELAATTHNPSVLEAIGPFAAVWKLGANLPADAVLVSSTDSVGTKSKVAVAVGRHQGIGQDIVNHCVNDVLTTGADPLFFLDYFASGRIEANVLEQLAEGMVEACRANGCALVGGETAEMPGVYGIGDYDLAGFLVGMTSASAVLGPARVQAGDRLLALPSTGLHTNGYSLVRHLLAERELEYDTQLPGTSGPIGELLLAVHASYLDPVRALRARGEVHALAHITGGGIIENLPRVLPPEMAGVVDRQAWQVPAIFTALQELGDIPEDELWSSFNMGVGMIAVVPPATVTAAAQLLAFGFFEIGYVAERQGPDRVLLR